MGLLEELAFTISVGAFLYLGLKKLTISCREFAFETTTSDELRK